MKFKAIIAMLMGVLYGGLFSGLLLWISLQINRPVGLLVFAPLPTGLLIAYISAIRQSTLMGKDYKTVYITFLGFLEGLLISICLITIFIASNYSLGWALSAAIIATGAVLGSLILIYQHRQWLTLRVRYSKFVALNQALERNLIERPRLSLVEKIKSFQFELPKIHPYVLAIAAIIFFISYYFLKNGDADQPKSLTIGIPMVLSFLFLLRIYLDYLLIDDYIYRHQGQLIFVTWAPLGPGWLGEGFPFLYLVKYKDDADFKSQYCKAGILQGVYFTDDDSAF